MVESMPWNWELLTEEQKKEWKDEPSKESYYLVDRWKKQGKKTFLDLGCGFRKEYCVLCQKWL